MWAFNCKEHPAVVHAGSATPPFMLACAALARPRARMAPANWLQPVDRKRFLAGAIAALGLPVPI